MRIAHTCLCKWDYPGAWNSWVSWQIYHGTMWWFALQFYTETQFKTSKKCELSNNVDELGPQTPRRTSTTGSLPTRAGDYNSGGIYIVRTERDVPLIWVCFFSDLELVWASNSCSRYLHDPYFFYQMILYNSSVVLSVAFQLLSSEDLYNKLYGFIT